MTSVLTLVEEELVPFRSAVVAADEDASLFPLVTAMGLMLVLLVGLVSDELLFELD